MAKTSYNLTHLGAATDIQVDITAPEHGVEVVVRRDRKVIWVNVDGICVLRICQIPKLDCQLVLDIPAKKTSKQGSNSP